VGERRLSARCSLPCRSRVPRSDKTVGDFLRLARVYHIESRTQLVTHTKETRDVLLCPGFIWPSQRSSLRNSAYGRFVACGRYRSPTQQRTKTRLGDKLAISPRILNPSPEPAATLGFATARKPSTTRHADDGKQMMLCSTNQDWGALSSLTAAV